GARSAEGRHGEVANVEAALHGDLAQCVGLVPRRDLENASGATLDPEPESSCEVLETGSRGSDVQGDLATEQVRRDAPEDQVRVGDGRLGAAAGVAQRAGVRPR